MEDTIKLIGLDLDGTVFNDQKQITNRTKAAIQAAINKGIIVVPVTGRPISGVPKELLAAVPQIEYALTANGAMVVNLKTGEQIYRKCIPYEQTQQLMDELLQEDIMVEPYINGEAYCQKSDLDNLMHFVKDKVLIQYFMSNRRTVEDIGEFVRQNKIGSEKLHLMFADWELREKTRLRLEAIDSLIITSANGSNLEINNVEVDKGKSLLKFGERFGIKREEIMGCGDNENDVPMIKAVGFSVAMGNATPRLKELADFVTLTNNEDGVAYAIEKFAL